MYVSHSTKFYILYSVPKVHIYLLRTSIFKKRQIQSRPRLLVLNILLL